MNVQSIDSATLMALLALEVQLRKPLYRLIRYYINVFFIACDHISAACLHNKKEIYLVS